MEEGWQVSGGGKAGRRARRRAAAKERQTQPMVAPGARRSGGGADDLRYPEWMCLACQEFQWATRLECRFCHAPRRMEPGGVGARTRVEEQPLELTDAPAAAVAVRAAAPHAAARGPATPAAAPPAALPAAGPPAPGRGAPTAQAAAQASAAGPAAARDTPAAVRAEEQRKLARLDAAILALGDGEEALLASMREARQRCAERVAGTQPLGRRLAAARRAHEQAAAAMKAAEKAAAAAAEKASRALEVEHAAAAAVEQLEKEVAQQRGRVEPLATQQAVAGEVAEFVSTVDHWLQAAGVSPPPEVAAAAEALRARMQPAPVTPTDLEAGMSDDEDSDAGALDGADLKRGPPSTHSVPSRAASVDGRDGRHRTPPPTQKAPRPDSARSR